MKSLEQKIAKAKQVILKASKQWPAKSIAVAWTGGKDSTALLHLVRTTFNNKIPFRVFFNDSTLEFPEIYKFVKKLTKQWQLDLIWQKHLSEDLKAYHSVIARSDATKQSPSNKKPSQPSQPSQPANSLNEQAIEIMRLAKINAINHALSKHKIKAFISGIRHDEHEARSKETYFSKRSTHTRVHPILHFTIDDIWDYIKLYNVPYVSLYDKGYKSLGEEPFTKAVKNKNAPERAGREATKEKTMERLRQLGYW